ncbi:MAG: MmgE/PrpD family protein [Rhizobiaceae bacterium]
MSNPVAFIHDLKFADLPEPIVQAAIRALTDTLGVAVAGSQTKLSTIIRNHVAEHFAAGSNTPAYLWNDGRPVSATGAALANGMTIDSVDAHDGQKLTKGHVGCGVIPALFALTEATGNFDSDEFLTSLVIGYEIGSRAGIALHSSVADYHTSGAWVALATAALGARYLGLDGEQTRHAIGIAEYHGPRSQMMRTIDHPTMVKDGSGWGSMAGVSAAYLAREGFTGAPAISMEAPELATIWGDLRDHWYITEQYIKLYPVCRWAQPPVEAVLNLQRQHHFEPDDLAAIRVHTFHEAKRLSTKHPKNTEEAQYSLPYSVAAALVHGTIGAEHVSDDALSNPDVARMQELIEISETQAFNEAFPKNRIASVELTLKDGQVLHSPPTEALGDPENPITETGVQNKFAAFTNPVIGSANAENMLKSITGLAASPAHSTQAQLTQLAAQLAQHHSS